MSARRTMRGHGKPAGHSAAGAGGGTRGELLGLATNGDQRLGRRPLARACALVGCDKRTGPGTRGAHLQAHRLRLVGLPRLALGSLGFSLFNSVSVTQRPVHGRFKHLGCGFLPVLDAHCVQCRAGHCSRTNHP
jgi:hypothetical protein